MACERKDKWTATCLSFVVFVVFIVLSAGVSLGHADETAIAGNKIMNSYKDAVVKVEVVMQSKIVMNGNEIMNKELKDEITGTVLNESGLVLVSLTTIDPSKLVDSLIRGMKGDKKMEVKLDIKSVKVILPDETELDAKVVLRDKDLDMAFIRPKQKTAKPMVSVKMAEQSNPHIMDEIIILNRLSKVANHVPSIMSGRISAIVNKPQTCYIPQVEGSGMEDIGTPAFTLDGKLAGVILMRVRTSEGEESLSSMKNGIKAVIMPVSEIVEDSKQAMDETNVKE
ncbi:MAG: trypsin-like peptidase domain-containing protein [Smithella sp.]|jgi:hypothetical protein